jgi:hypothetical protein
MIQHEWKEELHQRLTLLESFVAESKANEKSVKETLKRNQLLVCDCKKIKIFE